MELIMSLKNSLTNEQLNQRFDNPFALVNYAIQLAKIRIKRGDGLDANPANDILEMIADGHDFYELDESEGEEESVEEEKSI
jgi:hypothetical protein